MADIVQDVKYYT